MNFNARQWASASLSKKYRKILYHDHRFCLRALSKGIYNILLTIFIGILNIIYKDRGSGVKFAKLFNEIVELFPERKLNQLQDLILGKKSNKQKNKLIYMHKMSLLELCIFNFYFLDCIDFSNIMYYLTSL